MNRAICETNSSIRRLKLDLASRVPWASLRVKLRTWCALGRVLDALHEKKTLPGRRALF
jgi:hypothetical protein